MWPALIMAGASLAGSVYSANKNADAMEEANSGDLPDWLKPYVVGQGEMPGFVKDPNKTNTEWLKYIQQLGQGDTNAPWQPMSSGSIHFNPEQQFTPVDDGSQYGALPPGMNQPPGAQAPGGMDMDAMTQFMQGKELQNSISGMEDVPWSEGRQYSRGFRDMDRGKFHKMNTLYELMRGM